MLTYIVIGASFVKKRCDDSSSLPYLVQHQSTHRIDNYLNLTAKHLTLSTLHTFPHPLHASEPVEIQPCDERPDEAKEAWHTSPYCPEVIFQTRLKTITRCNPDTGLTRKVPLCRRDLEPHSQDMSPCYVDFV